MNSTEPVHIRSRANPLFKQLRQLAQTSTAYRQWAQVWLEGEHLCQAAAASNVQPVMAVFSESFWPVANMQYRHHAAENIVVPDALWSAISALASPAKVAWVLDVPALPTLQAGVGSVILDGIQDAGNVGSILRSAAAFGFRQIIALAGTAALWSPKVLRAAMGAHFSLNLLEGVSVHTLGQLEIPIVAAHPHLGGNLRQQKLPTPCAWALGHEGQGVSEALMDMAQYKVKIEQPGGQESLNVAAAAAICLWATSSGQS